MISAKLTGGGLDWFIFSLIGRSAAARAPPPRLAKGTLEGPSFSISSRSRFSPGLLSVRPRTSWSWRVLRSWASWTGSWGREAPGSSAACPARTCIHQLCSQGSCHAENLAQSNTKVFLHPQGNASLEVAHVGIDSAPIPDIVAGVGVGRT